MRGIDAARAREVHLVAAAGDVRALHEIFVPHHLDEILQLGRVRRQAGEAALDELPDRGRVAGQRRGDDRAADGRVLLRRGEARDRGPADQHGIGAGDVVFDVGQAVGGLVAGAAVAQRREQRLVVERGVDEELLVGHVERRAGRHALVIAEGVRDHGRVAGVPDRALHRGEGRGVGVAVIARAVIEADVAVGIDSRHHADIERTLARAALGIGLAVGALDIDGAAAALADSGQIGRQQLLEGLGLPGRQGRADAGFDEADHAGRHAESLQREMIERGNVLRRQAGLQRRAVADALVTLRQGHRSARHEVGRQRHAFGIEPQALDVPALRQRKVAVPEDEVFA